MRTIKPTIAKAFKEWEIRANKKDKEEFCKSVNALASALRNNRQQ